MEQIVGLMEHLPIVTEEEVMMQELANVHWCEIQYPIPTIHLMDVLVAMLPNVALLWDIMDVVNPGWNMICFQDVLGIMMGHMYVLVGTIQMEAPDVTEVRHLRDIRAPAVDPLVVPPVRLHNRLPLSTPAQMAELSQVPRV